MQKKKFSLKRFFRIVFATIFVGGIFCVSILSPRWTQRPVFAQTVRSPSTSLSASVSEEILTPSFSDRLPYSEIFGQVVCESDAPLADAGTIRAEIDALKTDLIDYLGIPTPNAKIGLCLFRDKNSYSAFLRAVCPQAPSDRPALYIKDNGPGFLFLPCDDKLILNLRHEMTHAYLNATLRHLPIWLDEGLAKYFETPPGQRGYHHPFLPDVATRAKRFLQPIPSLETLERLTRLEQMGPEQYRDAWAWTHFLIHYSPETQHQLAGYLATLRPEKQAGISLRQAEEIQREAPMTGRLKDSLPDYKRRYKEHFERWQKKTPP